MAAHLSCGSEPSLLFALRFFMAGMAALALHHAHAIPSSPHLSIYPTPGLYPDGGDGTDTHIQGMAGGLAFTQTYLYLPYLQLCSERGTEQIYA